MPFSSRELVGPRPGEVRDAEPLEQFADAVCDVAAGVNPLSFAVTV